LPTRTKYRYTDTHDHRDRQTDKQIKIQMDK
jgi:hypothetical protein